MRYWDTSALVPTIVDEPASEAMRGLLAEDPDGDPLTYTILNERHRPLSEMRPDLPPELVTLVDRCLEKAADHRTISASALAEELGAIRRMIARPVGSLLRTVAVLPLVDLSPRGDNRYFSDGLTEEITTRLTKLGGIRLVSRTSMMRFERGTKDTRQIAAEVGAQILLDGSVRKQGSDLRITTQLVDAEADVTLWAENFDGTIDDVFAIQETVARKVARALKLRLTPGERKSITRRPTTNAEAYQLYLRGRFFWNKRTDEGMRKAVEYFQQALRKDERFAQAWAGIADAFNLLAKDGDAEQKHMYQKAREAAQRALKIDAKLAEAHTSLAILIMLDEWDWERSATAFKRALRLNPKYGTAHHWYSQWLLYQGRLEESLTEIGRAADLDPLSPAIVKDQGMALYYGRRYDEAMEFARRALELDAEFSSAYRLVSLVHLAAGRFDEARDANARWGRMTGNTLELGVALAYIHALAGARDEALREVELLHPESLTAGSILRGIALVHVALGNYDQAFTWLDRSMARRAEALFSINVDPKMDPLRSDPRFESIVRRLGLRR